jgi:hypothetical protein
MTRLNEIAVEGMVGAVLRDVEKSIKALRPDTSATAPEHVTGYEAGFRAAKRAMFDALSEIQQ